MPKLQNYKIFLILNFNFIITFYNICFLIFFNFFFSSILMFLGFNAQASCEGNENEDSSINKKYCNFILIFSIIVLTCLKYIDLKYNINFLNYFNFFQIKTPTDCGSAPSTIKITPTTQVTLMPKAYSGLNPELKSGINPELKNIYKNLYKESLFKENNYKKGGNFFIKQRSHFNLDEDNEFYNPQKSYSALIKLQKTNLINSNSKLLTNNNPQIENTQIKPENTPVILNERGTKVFLHRQEIFEKLKQEALNTPEISLNQKVEHPSVKIVRFSELIEIIPDPIYEEEKTIN